MSLDFLTIRDIDLQNKRILIREDFNVPIVNERITNSARIRAALPTIKLALAQAKQVCLVSHLGRPNGIEEQYSLRNIVPMLQELLDTSVYFSEGLERTSHKLVLYENMRFFPGEIRDDVGLANKLADLCDIFVMDAFGSAHRAHASTVGVAEHAPLAVAGLLLATEVENLNRVMHAPKRPLVAIVGGAKVSSKIQVLTSLLHVVDKLIIGGGMANTFLSAQGVDVKESLYERDMLPVAHEIINGPMAEKVVLPLDVVWDGNKIMDIGEKSCAQIKQHVNNAKTILWNGPMGVFENSLYATGTIETAKYIAESDAYSVAGGGDTIAAIDVAKVQDSIDYISTGGGAFLEYIENKTLPGIKVLTRKVEYVS